MTAQECFGRRSLSHSIIGAERVGESRCASWGAISLGRVLHRGVDTCGPKGRVRSYEGVSFEE